MNSRTVICALIALVFWIGGCQGPGTTTSSAQPPVPYPKIVLFVIDGARYSETFGDSTHAWVPRIWSDLRPLGTVLTSFRNEGITTTVPGHTSMITGTWQTIANDGTERPDKPTIFEYFRYATGLPDSLVWVVSGKTKLEVCTWGTDPEYGPGYGAESATGYAGDLAVYNELIQVLQNEKPRLILACLPEVDWKGHSGIWEDYVAAIAGADSLACKTWQYLQSDPYYADQTWMFITNDHGRHDDEHGGFQNHGDGCEGCRRLMFLALGPDVKSGHTSDGFFTQRDICPTVGEIMQFPVPYSEGNVIQDIFEPVATGIKASPARERNPENSGN